MEEIISFESEEIREALNVFNPSQEDKEFLIENSLAPVKLDKSAVTLIFATSRDITEIPREIRNILQYRTKKFIDFYKVDSSLLSSLITHYLGTSDIGPDTEIRGIGVDINSSEVRRTQESILVDAAERRASDIHIEISSKAVVRIRVNGMLLKILETSRETGIGIIRAFLNDARMKIEDMYKPQGGRIKRMIGNTIYDMRLQTIGLINGPHLTIRLLPAEANEARDLTELGFEEAQAEALRKMIRKEGIIIFTGPTGSGKTTSMYSLLREIDVPEKKIITIEDPPEILVDSISQIAIKPERGITWETALQNALRQDPDVILIGEIRDSLGAKVAMEAALTGHLVLTTLHVKEIESIPERFLQFAEGTSIINRLTIADALTGLVSQRLIQKVYKPTAIKGPMLDWIRDIFTEKGITIKEPAVLANHKATGNGYYKGYDMSPDGRTVIAEVLYVDNGVKEIIKNESSHEIRSYLDTLNNHLTMAKHAAIKIQRGEIDPRDVAPLL